MFTWIFDTLYIFHLLVLIEGMKIDEGTWLCVAKQASCMTCPNLISKQINKRFSATVLDLSHLKWWRPCLTFIKSLKY
jgi:hypothetical protein